MKIYKTAQFREREELRGISNYDENLPPQVSQQPTGDPDETPLEGQAQAEIDVDWGILNEWYLTGGDELPNNLPKKGYGDVIINYSYNYNPYDASLDINVISVLINNSLITDKEILYIFEEYYDEEIKKEFWEMTRNI